MSVTEVQQPSNGLLPGADPDEIMVGPDGNLWFDDQNAGGYAVGKVDPATFAVTEYPLTVDATPWTAAFGADGDLYVAQTGTVAQVTASGVVTEIAAASSTSGSDGDAMIEGPDGNVYYNDLSTPPAVVQVDLDALASVSTGAATGVTASTATIAGSVTPLSADATVSVRYGTTPALGSTAPVGTLRASTTASAVTAGAVHSFTTAAGPPTTGPPKPTPTPVSTTARLADQRLTLTSPSTQVCTARTSTITARFQSSTIRGARPTLHLVRVTFTIDRGIAHRHRVTVRRHGHRRTVTVTTYRPNATARRSPATVRLKLAGLGGGVHRLTVTAHYTQVVGTRRHRRTVTRTRTLTARLRVC
jgi:hypothetical protein